MWICRGKGDAGRCIDQQRDQRTIFRSAADRNSTVLVLVYFLSMLCGRQAPGRGLRSRQGTGVLPFVHNVLGPRAPAGRRPGFRVLPERPDRDDRQSQSTGACGRPPPPGALSHVYKVKSVKKRLFTEEILIGKFIDINSAQPSRTSHQSYFFSAVFQIFV